MCTKNNTKNKQGINLIIKWHEFIFFSNLFIFNLFYCFIYQSIV